MFNRTTLMLPAARDQHHYHRSEVHEHRAPTDASVKLLRELEQAALDKILATTRLENCPVDVVLHYAADTMGLCDRFMVRYKLAGREVRVPVEVPTMGLHTASERVQHCMREVRKALAESLALEFLKGASASDGFWAKVFRDAARRNNE